MYTESDYASNLANMMVSGVGLISLAIGIVFYVLMALGFYTMAKNRGIDHAWFAWVPFLNLYLLGELTGNHAWGMPSKWVLLLAPFVFGILGIIPLIGWIFSSIGSIVYAIYYWVVLYQLYKMYTPDRAVLYIVLSILFSTIATPIIVFISRNKRPVIMP